MGKAGKTLEIFPSGGILGTSSNSLVPTFGKLGGILGTEG